MAATLSWTPGTVMGRVMMATDSFDAIEALFEVLHTAINQEQICEDGSDEASDLLFLWRMGNAACDHLREELKRLNDLALEENAREVRAERATRAERKEG